MSDLIDREKAIEAISKLPVKVDNLGYTWMIAIDVLKQIDDIPSEEPEQKRGEWIKGKEDDFFRRCSVCGYIDIAVSELTNKYYNFCPSCGTKMKGE
jgi:hypothetical protein